MSHRQAKYHCRMCETKMFQRSEDGLCASCHLALCPEGVGGCNRCKNMIDNLINWANEEDEED